MFLQTVTTLKSDFYHGSLKVPTPQGDQWLCAGLTYDPLLSHLVDSCLSGYSHAVVLSCEWTVLLSNLDLSNKEHLKNTSLISFHYFKDFPLLWSDIIQTNSTHLKGLHRELMQQILTHVKKEFKNNTLNNGDIDGPEQNKRKAFDKNRRQISHSNTENSHCMT